MTRRAAAGFARLLPLLLIAAAVVILVGAALLAACGGSSNGGTPEPTATVTVTSSASGSAEPTASPAASPSEATSTTLRLYFLRDGKLGVAERRVPRTAAIATASLKALLAGPTAAEQSAGLSTSLADGIRLNSLSIEGGVARVDLSSRFWKSGNGLTEADSLLPGAQIVYTLTRFPSVRRVAIRIDDEPYPAVGSSTSPSAEWRRRDFVKFEPAIFVETPGVGAVLSSPFTLSGTAMVFEGSFQARLVDSSGRRVVNVIMQASAGGPERGTFAKDVPYSTSAKNGTLLVFDQSMEDGSRQNEVRIPVTFSSD
jgi:hypothetical protein